MPETPSPQDSSLLKVSRSLSGRSDEQKQSQSNSNSYEKSNSRSALSMNDIELKSQ